MAERQRKYLAELKEVPTKYKTYLEKCKINMKSLRESRKGTKIAKRLKRIDAERKKNK